MINSYTLISPTFTDFFKSMYYSNTFLPPVDLSEQALSQHMLEAEDKIAAATAQAVISIPEVQAILSEPLEDDLATIEKNNIILQKYGFKILSNKLIGLTPISGHLVNQTNPFYSVMENANLPGWVIKSGARRVPKDLPNVVLNNDLNEVAFFTKEESLLRIAMAARIAKVARELVIDVVVPKKKLVAYMNLQGVTDVTKKYCIVAEKIDCLSKNQTIQAIKKMNNERQRCLADDISLIIQHAGLVEASFETIRLNSEGKLVFLSTKPGSLLVAKKAGAKSSSLEKCARIGLCTLMTQTSTPIMGTALNAFHKQIEYDYKQMAPSLAKWKIALCVLSLGLIPLITAIIALVRTQFAKQALEKLQTIAKSNNQRVAQYVSQKAGPLPTQEKPQTAMQGLRNENFIKDFSKQQASITKKYLTYIEGVPYTIDPDRVKQAIQNLFVSA